MFRTKINAGLFFALGLLAISQRIPWVSSAGLCDPNPCGKGAQCQDLNNLLVCACPDNFVGDPFESCRPTPGTESTSTSTGTTTSTSITSSSSSSSSTRSTSPSTQYNQHTSSSPSYSNNHDRDRDRDRTTSTEVNRDSSSSSSAAIYNNNHNPNQPVLIDTTSYRRNPTVPMSTTYTTNDNGHGLTYIRTSTSISPSGSGHSGLGGTNEMHTYRTSIDNDSRHPDRNRDQNRNSNSHSTTNTVRMDINDNNRDRDNNYYRNSQGNSNNDKTFMNRDGNGNMDVGHVTHYASGSGGHGSRETYYDGNGNRRVFGGANSHISSSGERNNNNNRGGFVTTVAATYSNERNSYHNSNSNKDYNSPNNVKDPLGIYSNCKKINGAVVCADNSDSGSSREKMHFISNDAPFRNSDFGNKPYFERDPIRPHFDQNRHDYDDNYSYRHHPAPLRNHNDGNGFKEFVVRSQSQESYSSSNNRDRNRDDKPSHSSSHLTPQPGDPDQCKKYCGQDAVCRSLLGRPICGCPDGYEGNAAVRCYPSQDQIRMKNRCYKHAECLDKEICDNSQCTDPCKDTYGASSNFHFRSKRYDHFGESGIIRNSNRNNNNNHHSLGSRYGSHTDRVSDSQGSNNGSHGNTCGRNTKCQVVDHTLLCGCLQGYTGNPYVGCA